MILNIERAHPSHKNGLKFDKLDSDGTESPASACRRNFVMKWSRSSADLGGDAASSSQDVCVPIDQRPVWGQPVCVMGHIFQYNPMRPSQGGQSLCIGLTDSTGKASGESIDLWWPVDVVLGSIPPMAITGPGNHGFNPLAVHVILYKEWAGAPENIGDGRLMSGHFVCWMQESVAAEFRASFPMTPSAPPMSPGRLTPDSEGGVADSDVDNE